MSEKTTEQMRMFVIAQLDQKWANLVEYLEERGSDEAKLIMLTATQAVNSPRSLKVLEMMPPASLTLVLTASVLALGDAMMRVAARPKDEEPPYDHPL